MLYSKVIQLYINIYTYTFIYVCVCVYIYIFCGGSDGKKSGCNAGDLGSIPGLGTYPGEGKGYPLQCSGLENSTDRSLAGYSPFGSKESGMTEQLALSSSPIGTYPSLHSPIPSTRPAAN